MDAEDLRKSIDLVAVVEALGLPLVFDGEWKTLCLWHDDHTPSLGIFENEGGFPYTKCFACGYHGDVFDVVGKARGFANFADAIAAVESMRASGLPEPRSIEKLPDMDLDAYASTVRAAKDHDGVILSLLSERSITAPLSFVRDEFRVGVDGAGDVIIPHYDAAEKVHAIKRRKLGTWEKKNVRGSRMDALYGEWRDKGRTKVIVAEGESDTWTLAWRFGADFDVLGLPSGVAEKPRDSWIERLRDRDVILAFDADDAGRLGLKLWISALANVAKSVRIGNVAEGEDVSVAFNPQDAPSISTIPLKLKRGDEGYLRVTKDGDVPISDWYVQVERVVGIADEQATYEVTFPPFHDADHSTFLRSVDDLTATTKLRRWANAREYAWIGNDADAQELLRLLKREALFAPRVRGTHVAGFHDDAFVLPRPSESIGSKAWAYVPPAADPALGERLSIHAGPFERQLPSILTRLHASQVVTPILGWCAAAVLRSTMPNFPILAVVGGAGYGKTTLVGEILRTFGFCSVPMTITSTTPHAVSSLIASTNAIPVWFDEYRRGARVDAKEKLDQKIRDAWDGSSSMKGGSNSANLQALTAERACAPIIVTGEDAFSETSHAERMVIVDMIGDGRSPEALAMLRAAERAGFGYAYLSWIIDAWKAGTIPVPPDALDRMTLSRALARWGYEIFRQFAREVCGLELVVDYDESAVLAAHEEMEARPPIIDALSALLDKRARADGHPIVWLDGPDKRHVCVRPEALVKNLPEYADIVLPGGSKAVRKWLKSRFTTSDDRNTFGRFVWLRDAADTIVFET